MCIRDRPDTTLRLEEGEKVPTCILGSVLRLEMIMQKGQDEVLARPLGKADWLTVGFIVIPRCEMRESEMQCFLDTRALKQASHQSKTPTLVRREEERPFPTATSVG